MKAFTALVATSCIAFALAAFSAAGPARATTPSKATLARWQHEAANVTITRDNWGIPHIHGTTDADAVFGMMYAQCEDDFKRVEGNYLLALGRRAEALGKSALWTDLRRKLYVNPAALKKKYAASPAWLKKLMNAWADGLNYYLYTHPAVHPRVIKHYEAWMPLAFAEGSIGGDVSRVSAAKLAAFYGDADPQLSARLPRSLWDVGSNGIAIAPKLTVDGHALLLINPHTTFYFRTESQMSSDEGLDAYGASTWGQFFIYQGFNKHVGWMHTSTGADSVDQFAETIVHKGGKLYYHYGKQLLPVKTRKITVRYRTKSGGMAARTFTAYYTQHGPVVAKTHGKWITEQLMWNPIKTLEQSWLRTKANNLAQYRKVDALKANSSNDTIYADDQGNIAFFMPQFIPKRDNQFDYTQPVDGANPATAWQGRTPLNQMPNAINPPNGWVMNTNDWPYSTAGKYSPKPADFPRYMDHNGPNPRARHVTLMLTGAKDFTIGKLIADAYDSYMPAFARLIPILVHDYDALPAASPLRKKLASPISLLRHWDDRWGVASIPTTLAVVWGNTLWAEELPKARAAGGDVYTMYDYVADKVSPKTRLAALSKAIDYLKQNFGYWAVPWGYVNRYQRLDDSIQPHFDDAKPSLPVPFTSSRWGSLASDGAHYRVDMKRWPGVKRYYGNDGNSFVAVVEFGPRVHARAIKVGGQSGNPASPHFTDQVPRYLHGNLREVYFWPDQLKGHIEAKYHPGGKHDPGMHADKQQAWLAPRPASVSAAFQ